MSFHAKKRSRPKAVKDTAQDLLSFVEFILEKKEMGDLCRICKNRECAEDNLDDQRKPGSK